MEQDYSKTERIIATIRALAMIVTSVAAGAGFALDANIIEQVALCVAFVAATVWGYWKNNNWTKAAQEAQKYLEAAKAEEKTEKAEEKTEE